MVTTSSPDGSDVKAEVYDIPVLDDVLLAFLTPLTGFFRAMLTLEDLDPARLAAVGRADTVPRADNDSPEGRAKNRRTEIVVLFPTLEG